MESFSSEEKSELETPHFGGEWVEESQAAEKMESEDREKYDKLAELVNEYIYTAYLPYSAGRGPNIEGKTNDEAWEAQRVFSETSKKRAWELRKELVDWMVEDKEVEKVTYVLIGVDEDVEPEAFKGLVSDVVKKLRIKLESLEKRK